MPEAFPVDAAGLGLQLAERRLGQEAAQHRVALVPVLVDASRGHGRKDCPPARFPATQKRDLGFEGRRRPGNQRLEGGPDGQGEIVGPPGGDDLEPHRQALLG